MDCRIDEGLGSCGRGCEMAGVTSGRGGFGWTDTDGPTLVGVSEGSRGGWYAIDEPEIRLLLLNRDDVVVACSVSGETDDGERKLEVGRRLDDEGIRIRPLRLIPLGLILVEGRRCNTFVGSTLGRLYTGEVI